MSFALKEVLPPSSVTTAALIPGFTSTSDTLAVARGNRLFLYPVEGDYLGEPNVVRLYGNISKIIPLSYSMTSNILVILSDLRSCVLRFDEDKNEVETVSTGNLMQNKTNSMSAEFRYAFVPSALVVQLHAYILTVFPITSYSTLGAPFPITIPCKTVLDFVFIGPISKVTRLAVLTEEISDNPKLHLIEIDLTNNIGTEDPKQTISLPDDTYLILPYQPDTSSVVFCFSSLKATSVTYAAGLPPVSRTHTIFTPSMLKWYAQMKDSFYMFVDEKGSIRVTELNEHSKISFVDISKCSIPSCVVAISPHALFIGSKSGASHLYHINKNSLESLVTFDSADEVLGFEESDNTFAVCQNATTRIDPLLEINEHVILGAKGLSAIWCKAGEENDLIVATSLNQTVFLEGADGVYEQVANDSYITNEQTVYVAFEPFVQVTLTTARFEGHEINGDFSNATSDNSAVVLITPKDATLYSYDGNIIKRFEFVCTAACLSYNCLVLATEDSVIFYDEKFKETRRIPISRYAVSIAYDGSTYVVAHARDYVTLISGSESNLVSCPGYHSTVQIIHGKAVVFGEVPVTFENGNRIFFGSQSLLSGYELNDQMMLLSRRGIIIAQEGKRSTTHFSYSNEKNQIQCIKKIHGGYIMASNKYLCFAKDITEERKVFFQSEEVINDVAIVDNLVVAITAHHILCFSADNAPQFDLLLEKESQNVASQCGLLQNLFYVVYPRIDQTSSGKIIPATIQFFCLERASQKSAVLEEYSKIKLESNVRAIAAQGEMLAIAMDCGFIRVFSMNDHSPEAREIAAGTVTHEVTALAFLNGTLFAGTEQGVVLALSLTLDSTKKISVVYASKVGPKITALSPHVKNNGIFVGTSLGQVYDVCSAAFPADFSSIYTAIEERFFSMGHFSKNLERSVMINQLIFRCECLIDLDILDAFFHAPVEVQQKVLSVCSVPFDEAIKKISGVVSQLM